MYTYHRAGATRCWSNWRHLPHTASGAQPQSLPHLTSARGKESHTQDPAALLLHCLGCLESGAPRQSEALCGCLFCLCLRTALPARSRVRNTCRAQGEVGFWHFAHSFVRGNWRNEAESTFSLLAKSCHDIDLINFWMGDKRCLKVSSFGSLSHFTNEHKPKGAASRCLDCSVEQTCPYSAKKIYLHHAEKGYFNWPVSVVCNSGVCDIESVTEALRSSPYGRCVYECDNDVVSNQVVNMEFEGGATAAFTMMAFTERLGTRKTTIYGTKGELFCDGGGPVQVFDFCTREKTAYPTNKSAFIPSHLMGHDGADYYLMDSFISALTENKPSLIQTGPEATLQSHLLVFEAEKSRKENRVVFLETRKELFPKPTYK
ncbi:uncharacterized protein LOC127030140 isoform X5 [Gopherus flavomarginatus]|uniref:uncharacterized protein LOC127030140 isoform X5 n=1 Tax=Gopherus flavomarginatus TaxID=286002 RepID=UPI0021CC2B55|nr:uncharacterized protein LOC127030140 isoform X5 [Gopherus flavomarginatus]